MKLNTQEALMQKSLVMEVNEKAQRLQESPSKNPLNPMLALTACAAKLINNCDSEDIQEIVEVLSEALAMNALTDQRLAQSIGRIGELEKVLENNAESADETAND